MRIGIDLGGTKIEGIVLADDGREIARARIAAPHGTYTGTLKAITGLVDHLAPTENRETPVGIGIPGTVSPATGTVKNANSTWLIGQPFDTDIAKLLDRPTRVANDANCFAVSEATDGSGRGERVVFGVILGTGVGGGIVVDGEILTGRNAIAGEWGHTPLPWMTSDECPGRHCYCGRDGCIETFLSGPALSRDYSETTGVNMEPAKIVRLAEQGDRSATGVLANYEDRLARALAAVVTVLDPDVIVLGGGLSKIERLYDNVAEKISGYAFSDIIATPVRPPAHGDSSGVRGAAWLWPAQKQIRAGQ
ncbi:MAG: ROK family protein [Alphaproteobacteria bacterium]|nr:ROK family protein [Alphaproteobacteria bacterium]